MKKESMESSRNKTPNSALLLILVVLIVAVSGCVANFPGTQKAGILNPTAVSETQDLVLKAEAAPLEVRGGKTLKLFFEIDALKDLKNLSFNITDACLLSGDTKGFESEELKANRSRDFKFSLTAADVSFDTDCQIRFKVNYSAELVAAQDIIVLDDTEFLSEQRTGKIGERVPRSVSTDNPLQIAVSFSSFQPFENGTEEFMYIEYSNTGSGTLEKLEKGSVRFGVPGNAKIACDDYAVEGNRLMLNRELAFINGRAKKSSCKITMQAQQPVDSKTFQLTAKYKYAIDNFISVKIKQK